MGSEYEFIDLGSWTLLRIEKFCMYACGRTYRYMGKGVIEKGKWLFEKGWVKNWKN